MQAVQHGLVCVGEGRAEAVRGPRHDQLRAARGEQRPHVHRRHQPLSRVLARVTTHSVINITQLVYIVDTARSAEVKPPPKIGSKCGKQVERLSDF